MYLYQSAATSQLNTAGYFLSAIVSSVLVVFSINIYEYLIFSDLNIGVYDGIFLLCEGINRDYPAR